MGAGSATGRIEPKITYEHLRQMPDDGKRHELLEGDLVTSPAPRWRHQRIVAKLLVLLYEAERAGFGQVAPAPTDVVFDAESAVAEPDLLFIAKDRLGIVTEGNVWVPRTWSSRC